MSEIVAETRSWKILGIDPGSRVAGFGLLQSRTRSPVVPRDFRILEAGVIRLDVASHLSDRLGHLHDAIAGMIAEATPTICVIEKAFCGVNASSALKLGEVRGAVISAVRRQGVPVAEITPAQVKMLIAGRGQASKQEVCSAIESCLQFSRGRLPHDATDALAIALAYGISQAAIDWR